MSDPRQAPLKERSLSPRTEEKLRFVQTARQGLLLALVIHLCLVPTFALLQVPPMAWFNVLSVFLFLLALRLLDQGYISAAYLLAGLEILSHSVLAVANLGLESGFQYYVLAFAPTIFYQPWWSLRRKIALSMPIVGLYLLVYGYGRYLGGIYTLDPGLTFLIHQGNVLVTMVAMCYPAYYLSTRARNVEKRLSETNRVLEALAATDPLTQLLNRRAMIEQLERAFAHFQRSGRSFSLLLCDLDSFKLINDRYGHDGGDFVLERAARLFENTLRKQDYIARWGGEEFLVLLPDTELSEAEWIAERLRVTTERERFAWQEQLIHVTLTCGVSVSRPGDSLERCVSRADRALYRGKHSGKNCIRVDEATAPLSPAVA